MIVNTTTLLSGINHCWKIALDCCLNEYWSISGENSQNTPGVSHEDAFAAIEDHLKVILIVVSLLSGINVEKCAEALIAGDFKEKFKYWT